MVLPWASFRQHSGLALLLYQQQKSNRGPILWLTCFSLSLVEIPVFLFIYLFVCLYVCLYICVSIFFLSLLVSLDLSEGWMYNNKKEDFIDYCLFSYPRK